MTPCAEGTECLSWLGQRRGRIPAPSLRAPFRWWPCRSAKGARAAAGCNRLSTTACPPYDLPVPHLSCAVPLHASSNPTHHPTAHPHSSPLYTQPCLSLPSTPSPSPPRRGLFATHYHRLSDSHASDPDVDLMHMACEVTPAAEAGGVDEVTFLYKLVPGACPKSYGVNVARWAAGRGGWVGEGRVML